MRDALKVSSGIRNSAEYACVERISLAWREITGELPTLTRNVDAVSGEQATSFQRFLALATPTIGGEIIRAVVDTMRQTAVRQLGVNGRKKQPKKTPKGKIVT